MLRMGRHLFAASLVFLPAGAIAQSDAYKVGYSAGQLVGRLMGLALPVVAVAIAVAVGWLVHRAWRQRRAADARRS